MTLTGRGLSSYVEHQLFIARIIEASSMLGRQVAPESRERSPSPTSSPRQPRVRARPRILPQRRNVCPKPMQRKARRVSPASATKPKPLPPRRIGPARVCRFATRAAPQHVRNGKVVGAHGRCGVSAPTDGRAIGLNFATSNPHGPSTRMSRNSFPEFSEVQSRTRTSVTIDEAIGMLLGWIAGPLELRSNTPRLSEEDEAETEAYCFDLNYRLHELREGLDADLSWAEHEGRQSDVQRLRIECEELAVHESSAFTYRCAIEDELNRGAESELRVDKTLPNDAVTYITIASFDQWALKRYNRQFLDMPQQVSEGVRLPSKAETSKARTLLREQEKAILACIANLGHDPTQLPKNRPGKPGVKKQVRTSLANIPLFKGAQVFDKAWERLRKGDEIVDA